MFFFSSVRAFVWNVIFRNVFSSRLVLISQPEKLFIYFSHGFVLSHFSYIVNVVQILVTICIYVPHIKKTTKNTTKVQTQEAFIQFYDKGVEFSVLDDFSYVPPNLVIYIYNEAYRHNSPLLPHR